MALVPRQTGSSIKMFILAAAIQAGAQPNDTIDGRARLPAAQPRRPDNPFLVEDGVAGQLGTLDQATWLSLNCAYARLSQIVGLNRVVDTTYRMARSNYLYRGQPEEDREPIQPYASFATGANEMSPLDMAAGAQTLANNGVAPRAVLRRVGRHRRRRTPLHPRSRARAGVRRGHGAHHHQHLEGRAAPGHRPPGAVGLPVPRRRQDRHPAGQHQLVVRRLRRPSSPPRCGWATPTATPR